MRAKTIKLPSFDELYDTAPSEIKDILDQCKSVPQSGNWHPEAPNAEVPHNVLAHIKIVYNRALKYGDINLLMTALFHDLGKLAKTKLNNKGGWTAIGHELTSADLVEKYKDWVRDCGASWIVVYELVTNHMRIKQIDEMRPAKQKAFKEHPLYKDLMVFTEFDNMKTLTSEEMKIE